MRETSINETFFGSQETFAIRYVAGYKSVNNRDYFAFLHLVLSGQVIGDPGEVCLVPGWIHRIKEFKNKITDRFQSMWHKEFVGRSDKEVFALVWKANGASGPEYADLPVLDNDVWLLCSLSIDETTDAWLITTTEENDKLKFIWKGWREPCPVDRIGKLYSVVVNREIVVAAIESCVKEIESIYSEF